MVHRIRPYRLIASDIVGLETFINRINSLYAVKPGYIKFKTKLKAILINSFEGEKGRIR